MQTQLLPISKSSINQAAAIIRGGGLVAFPTETVYGLGANALDAAAVSSIFAAKGRPQDNPLIVHIADLATAYRLAQFTPLAMQLAQQFWPGPLTLVLNSNSLVPDVVTAGLSTVALRFPAHAAAQQLIAASGLPIAAPSANISGRPSPTLAAHVLEDLDSRIPLILDGGAVEIGLESTVVDATGSVPLLLRPGQISEEHLRRVAGACQVAKVADSAAAPPSPGMKYRHYAPKGQLQLVSDWRAAEAAQLGIRQRQGAEPLLLLTDATAEQMLERHLTEESNIIRLGNSKKQYAANLFAALREADVRAARFIIAETVEESGLGQAIMNRLNKAAGGK